VQDPRKAGTLKEEKEQEGEKLNLELKSRPDIRTEAVLGAFFEKFYQEGDLPAFSKFVIDHLWKDAPNRSDLVLPRLNIVGYLEAMKTFRSLSNSFNFDTFSFIGLDGKEVD
jgi:hypothetical protein